MRLIYVNSLGLNYNSEKIYEFIFSDLEDISGVTGDGWDEITAVEDPTPPEIQFISKVGTIKTSDLDLNLIQKSDFFSIYDSVDGVIALAWEDDDTIEITSEKYKRLTFHFGEDIESVENKLYERDIVLKYIKDVVKT